MLLCLREPPVRFLWCCCSSFLIFICRCFFVLLLFFIHIFFSHVISHPSVDYLLPGFYTHFIFSAQPIAELIRGIFIFNHSVIFLPRAQQPWVSFFYPQAFFYLTFFHRHFNLRLSWLPWQPAVLSWSLQGFILMIVSIRRPVPSVCLIQSNLQSSYSERFSFKFYYILAWITCGSSLIYLFLTRFELFSLVQSHM